ncbi:hypothetical protein DFH27DRAFT_7107 [Peziza echinospora]|nr:hypothetical protein DFH27DRAFT_7107 [Peziza echinospora]
MSTHSDEDSSVLSESTYEILHESTLHLTDDDDDGGSSVNSFDDDDCSIDGITNIEDTDSLRGYTLETNENHGIPSFGGLDEFHMHNSANTLRGEFNEDHIEFEEPEGTNDFVSVTHTLQEFSQDEAERMLASLRMEKIPDRLLCTVRQSMCHELLCLDEPFRFLYIGSTSAKDEIFNKLGAALALPVVECASSTISSDSKSSRFNVVPVTSFGLKSSAEVELIESFGVEMALDICSKTNRELVDGQPDTLSMCLNGNQWVKSTHGEGGFMLDAPNWKLPHLAVFFCSEDDTLDEKLTRIYTRSFMGRHSVPNLVISQKSMCHKSNENISLDRHSIHMCLESRSAISEEVVHKRLPIDLATFSRLDVRQMNRNLGYITGLGKPAEEGSLQETEGSLEGSSCVVQDSEEQPITQQIWTSLISWIKNNNARDIIMIAAISWIAVCGLAISTYSMLSKEDITKFPVAEMNAASTPPVNTALSISTSASSTSSGLAKPTSSLARTKMPTSCVYPVDIASLLLEPTPLAANDSQEFKVHIIGENNIILRPPQHYSASRKPPPMNVTVTRNGESISSELTRLFDGVYTVIIPQEDAWGLLNISIQTKSKPILDETFELDFGVPWFKLTGWKKIALQQKHELLKLAEKASSRGKVVVGEIGQRTSEIKHQTQELLLSKVKEVKEDVLKHASGLFQNSPSLNIKQFWPVKGNYYQRAQRQAVRVWNQRKGAGDKSTGESCSGNERGKDA